MTVDDDSHYQSDKSVDYLSPVEDELIELINRMKANKEAKAKAKDNPASLKTADKDGITEDPFISVEKHVEWYPMYDETTHWRLRKPKVGENYGKVILDSNPGSIIKLGVTVNPDDKTYFDSTSKPIRGWEPKTYRRILLQYLDELDKLIDERVLKYDVLRMKEKEVQAIKEIENALDARLVIEGTTLKSMFGHTIQLILQKAGQTDQTLRMSLPKEDNVYTGKQGLAFEN
ncbi:hypothetical protein Tco_0006555 [Tanacetum coccineum]